MNETYLQFFGLIAFVLIMGILAALGLAYAYKPKESPPQESPPEPSTWERTYVDRSEYTLEHFMWDERQKKK